MFSSILNRMIFLELLKVFLLSLLAITGLLLLAGIFTEASQHGLSPGQILGVLPLLIPNSLPYTLPATTLFATCVVYGRLAHDNEILAIKAAGIHLLRAIGPAILLGAISSGATAALYYQTIPETHHQLRNRFLNDIEDLLYSMLRRQGCITHPRINYVIFVKRVEGRKLLEAQFMRRDTHGHFDIVARAREAELKVDLQRRQILVHMSHCHISSENNKERGYLGNKTWEVELPEDFFKAPKFRTSDMSWPELEGHRQLLMQERAKLVQEIELHRAAVHAGNAPEHFTQHVKDLTNQKRRKDNEIHEVAKEMHMRPALALGCLCFVLVGCPIGIWSGRRDYLSTFISCFLPIVIIYYPLLLCGVNLGRTGQAPVGLAIWTANGLMAIIAVILFRRLLKH